MFFCSALTATRTMMKMASVFTFSLLLLCFSVVNPAASQNNCDVYAVTGRDIVVPLNSKVKDPLKMIWKYNGDVIFQKRGIKLLNGKADDVDQTGSLKLKNLTISQSGTYTPEVFNQDGKTETSLKSIRLCVIAAVQKPKVEMECEDSDVKFNCVVQEKDAQKTDISVAWRQNDKPLDNITNWSVEYEAEMVQNDLFTCIISNQVSYEVSDPVQQTCFENAHEFTTLPEVILDIPTGGLPDEGKGVRSSFWVFVSSGLSIVLVLWC